MSSSEGNSRTVEENPMMLPVIDLDKLPLFDQQYKIYETQCEFDLYELHNWAKWKLSNASDELSMWASFLPQFIFPQTHFFPEFVT